MNVKGSLQLRLKEVCASWTVASTRSNNNNGNVSNELNSSMICMYEAQEAVHVK